MSNGPEIQIRRMRLRVPAASKQDALAAAQHLRERIGNLPTGAAPQHIGGMRLRVPIPAGSDPAHQAHSVASAISNRLARGRGGSHA